MVNNLQQLYMEHIKVVKEKFLRLSFKHKLLLAFSLSTFLTLTITNIIMHLLLNSIGSEDIAIITQENQQFNQVSTMQIVESLAKVGLTTLDRYSQILLQLVQAQAYFSVHPQIYISLQTVNPYSPPLTQSFSTPSFSSPGLYFNTPQSTFYNDSYFDVILSNIPANSYTGIKRINIFYLNDLDKTDVMIRTLPGTNDFTVNNISNVLERANNLKQQYFEFGSPYLDQLTKSTQKDQLMSLRTIVHPINNTDSTPLPYKIIIQIQIFQASVKNILQNVYYFPSTNVFFIEFSNGKWNVISSLKPLMLLIQTQKSIFSNPGYNKQTIANGSSLISGTVGIRRSHKLSQYSQFTYSNQSQFRFIIVTDQAQSSFPYSIMSKFLVNQSTAILVILYSWGAFVLMVSMGLAIVVGNHVFHHLHLLASKSDQYIKNPSKLAQIVEDLRSLKIKGTIKRLIDSLIKIMDKIESRKKEITECKNQKYKFPLNICYRQFQKRTGMNDYLLMDAAYEELCKKYPKVQKSKEHKDSNDQKEQDDEKHEKISDIQKDEQEDKIESKQDIPSSQMIE